MKKVITALIIVAIAGLGIWKLKSTQEVKTSDKPIIKIGLSLALTGDMTYGGIPTKEAAIMALEEWRTKDTKFNYELIFEDDQFTQKGTVAAGNRLMNLEKVNALISIWNLSNYQFREKIKQANIPFLSCSWGHDTNDGKLLFNNQTPHSEHARVLTEIVKNKLEAKNVAFIGLLSNGDIALHDYIEKDFNDNGINIIFKEVVNYGTRDYKTLIQKMKQKDPEAVVAILAPAELQVFTKQLREANLPLPITTLDYFEGVQNPEMFEGQYMAMSSAGSPEFKEKLGKRINFAHSDCMAAGYDNVDLLIYSFENAKAEKGEIPSTEEVIKVLKDIKHWNGATSDDMTVREDGRIFSKAKMGIIRNGKVEIVE